MPLPLRLTLFELKTLLGGDLEVWGNPPALTLTELVSFDKAEWGGLVVLPERATPTKIARCRAGVVVGASVHHPDWLRGRIQLDEPGWFLRVEDPAKAFLKLLEGPCRPLDDREDWLSTDEIVRGWGPQARTAMIHRGARIGKGTRIGSGVVVHARVQIGEGCRIGEASVLGAPGFGFSALEGGRIPPIPHWAGLHLDRRRVDRPPLPDFGRCAGSHLDRGRSADRLHGTGRPQLPHRRPLGACGTGGAGRFRRTGRALPGGRAGRFSPIT
jgi:hypothetical protein